MSCRPRCLLSCRHSLYPGSESAVKYRTRDVDQLVRRRAALAIDIFNETLCHGIRQSDLILSLIKALAIFIAIFRPVSVVSFFDLPFLFDGSLILSELLIGLQQRD